MTQPITPTMQDALEFAREHDGKLTRHPGGFWCGPSQFYADRPGCRTRWFGSVTVEALVSRGLMHYSAWVEGKQRFPVEATLRPEAVAYSAEREGV
jgi:hypothetical protein